MGKHTRWHDKRPELSKAVHFLSSLPDEVQTIIGECVIQVAEKEFRISDLMGDLKTMGTEKVMGLHQAQKRRRSYDQNAMMHKAVACIYVLPDGQQTRMAAHVLDLMDNVMNYFQTYREFSAPANTATLRRMTLAFVDGGGRAAGKIVFEIREDLARQTAADKVEVLAGEKVAKGTVIRKG